jgi:hypothetical protein
MLRMPTKHKGLMDILGLLSPIIIPAVNFVSDNGSVPISNSSQTEQTDSEKNEEVDEVIGCKYQSKCYSIDYLMFLSFPRDPDKESEMLKNQLVERGAVYTQAAICATNVTYRLDIDHFGQLNTQ